MNSLLSTEHYVYEILILLPYNELFSLSIVCKLWKKILLFDIFWKKKVLITFPSFKIIPKLDFDRINWKKWMLKKYTLNDYGLKMKNYLEDGLLIPDIANENIKNYLEFFIDNIIMTKHHYVSNRNWSNEYWIKLNFLDLNGKEIERDIEHYIIILVYSMETKFKDEIVNFKLYFGQIGLYQSRYVKKLENIIPFNSEYDLIYEIVSINS